MLDVYGLIPIDITQVDFDWAMAEFHRLDGEFQSKYNRAVVCHHGHEVDFHLLDKTQKAARRGFLPRFFSAALKKLNADLLLTADPAQAWQYVQWFLQTTAQCFDGSTEQLVARFAQYEQRVTTTVKKGQTVQLYFEFGQWLWSTLRFDPLQETWTVVEPMA